MAEHIAILDADQFSKFVDIREQGAGRAQEPVAAGELLLGKDCANGKCHDRV